MNAHDILDMIGDAKDTYVWDAQEVRSGNTTFVIKRKMPVKRILLIAAIIVLLAVTITACAYAIQRIRMNLVQHNVPAQTEMIVVSEDQPTETQSTNVLTDCYPQIIPEGYSILCSRPVDYNSRVIEYKNTAGNIINFRISTMPINEEMALKPPVEESTVAITCGEAILQINDGAQVLTWHNDELDYDAILFTDDVSVDLISIAKSMGYGEPIPLSVWYYQGQEWNPWYPQTVPEGYTCIDITPVSNGYQTFTYENGRDGYIRFGISTEGDLAPTEISDQGYWEEAEVNGVPAKMKYSQSTQRALFWENKEEGFYAFLETMDETVDLVTLAESVGPGSKMEISKSWLGPDFTIELEQDATTYVEWQSVYPQEIPAGYELDFVGNRAYGEQTIEWKNSEGDTITYTLYFRLGQYDRQFEGVGQPKSVSVNGLAGFLTGNHLLWADGKLGFGYDLHVTGDVDLIALAESVGPGPELALTNDKTDIALEQLGDYQITALPNNMVEDGLSGAPLEDGNDWYSYVRRWYYDKTNNDHVYFTYETYLTDCSTVEDFLQVLVSELMGESELVTINGNPGIYSQDGSRAKVAWVIGDVSKGISFQMYSEQFTVAELLKMAESVQKQ